VGRFDSSLFLFCHTLSDHIHAETETNTKKKRKEKKRKKKKKTTNPFNGNLEVELLHLLIRAVREEGHHMKLSLVARAASRDKIDDQGRV
jgi:hypothetical protein